MFRQVLFKGSYPLERVKILKCPKLYMRYLKGCQRFILFRKGFQLDLNWIFVLNS